MAAGASLRASAAVQLRRTRFYEAMESAAGMADIGQKTVRLAVRRPYAWVPDAVVEISLAVRRTLFANAVATGVYMVGFAIIALGTVLRNIGVADREAGGVTLVWVREPSTWLTMMVFAGIVGSAITADIGARRVREELDALSVLGVDSIRSLVVPRVIAVTIAAPILATSSMVVVVVLNGLIAPGKLGFTPGVYIDNIARSIYPLDYLVTLLVKNLIIGFFVGVVACHKGLTCKLGSEGVGRAVNQTVIITFFGIWMFNSVYNLAYLSLLPSASVFRG
jgi:phospholipid/cholesterol/gamma-HCH transport system permease protein